MQPIFLGVDVAGAANTWVAALSSKGDGNLVLVDKPGLTRLKDIVSYCEQHYVIAVALDAQLTMALSDENGFRTSNKKLRPVFPSVPEPCCPWINSLMFLPIHGQL